MYADKNKLSSFGSQKGYPVALRCANLPISMRNGTGLGGGVVVGWLPVVRLLFEDIIFTKNAINRSQRIPEKVERLSLLTLDAQSGINQLASY